MVWMSCSVVAVPGYSVGCAEVKGEAVRSPTLCPPRALF